MAIEIWCMDCEKQYFVGVENTSIIGCSSSMAIIRTTCPRCEESSQKEIKNSSVNNNVSLNHSQLMHQYIPIAKKAITEKLINFSIFYTCNVWNPLVNQGNYSMDSLVIRNNKRKMDIAIIRTSDKHRGHVILDVYKENADKLPEKERKELEAFLLYISEYFGLVCPYFVR